jgi:PAS domain S-box-containing protein
LRVRLLLLVLLLVTALLGLAGAAVWQAHEASRDRAASQMLGITRVLAQLVDGEFARAEALLQGVASDPEIASGDVDAFLAASRRIERALDGLALAIAEAPGTQLANSLRGRMPPGTPMPGGLDEVFRTDRTAISDLYTGSVTGEPVVALAVPVRALDGEPTRYAIGLTLNRARLRDTLARQHLPEGAVAAVLDRQRVVVARTRREEAVVGRRATTPVIEGLAANEAGLIERITNQDGEVSVVAYARAPMTGYAVAMAIPEATFARERNATLTRLAWGAAPVAAVALLAAFLLGLRLRVALARLGAGDGPRLAEVDELAASLAAADAARAASEAALRNRTAWLEATQDAAEVGTWDYDLRTGVVGWSPTTWRLFGLDPARDGPPSPTRFRELVLEEDRGLVDAAGEEAKRSGAYRVEYRIRRGDGAVRWIRAQGVLERDSAGQPRRLLGANLDITERRALEAEREALAAQKDLLVQEMHHRVKNSLQLVQSLLLLQARGAEPAAAERLREAAGRIVSIAAVHRRLYEGGGPQQDAADHLAGLVEDLRRSVGHAGRDIVLDAAPGLRLPPERMAALGLLATELVTNAMKHGAGRVTLRLTHDAALAELRVEDEGGGFAQGFDPAASKGLGMRVALAMARQLRGGVTVTPGPGGRVIATFPVSSHPSPSREDPAASR